MPQSTYTYSPLWEVEYDDAVKPPIFHSKHTVLSKTSQAEADLALGMIHSKSTLIQAAKVPKMKTSSKAMMITSWGKLGVQHLP